MVTSVAVAIGGKQTKNSGATPWQKGDVLTSGSESFLIECKTKTKKSDTITIREDWFEKNRQEMAFQGKKHQAVVFSFGPDEENHYIIDEYLFQELLEYLQSKGKTIWECDIGRGKTFTNDVDLNDFCSSAILKDNSKSK